MSHLAGGQEVAGVHGLAVLANLEMEHDTRRAALAHRGYLLATADGLALGHGKAGAMGIGAKVGVVVFDNE